MIVDITRLRSGIDENIKFDFNYSFSKEELENSGILELNDIKISGFITNGFDDYHIKCNINGVMVLPCAISLKPTNYSFNVEIDNDLSELLEENNENNQNTIDIFPIIWENILVEVPPRVINEDLSDVKTEGKGWKVVTGEEERINPELEKLKDLL